MSGPCNYLRRLEDHRLITAAILQAMREFGVPEHPNDECPTEDCNCTDPAVETRAVQIAEEAMAARKAGRS